MASRLRIGTPSIPPAAWEHRGRDVLEVPEIQYLISSYAPALNFTAASLFLAGIAFWVIDPEQPADGHARGEGSQDRLRGTPS